MPADYKLQSDQSRQAFVYEAMQKWWANTTGKGDLMCGPVDIEDFNDHEPYQWRDMILLNAAKGAGVCVLIFSKRELGKGE